MKKITEFTAEKLDIAQLLEVKGGIGTWTGELDFDYGVACKTNMCKRKACKKKACQSNA